MNYKKLKKCRLCKSNKLKIFIDFHKMPLAGAFLSKAEIKKEFKYPMAMQFCNKCSNVLHVHIHYNIILHVCIM